MGRGKAVAVRYGMRRRKFGGLALWLSEPEFMELVWVGGRHVPEFMDRP